MSDNLIEVGVKFNAAGVPAEVKKVEQAIEGLGAEAKEAGRELEQMATKGDKAEGAVTDLGQAAEKTEKKVDGMGKRGAGRAKKAVDELGREAKETGRELGCMADQGENAEASLVAVAAAAARAEQRTGSLLSRLSKGTSGFSRYSNTIQSTGRVMQFAADRAVNQYTAIIGGAGLGLIAKRTMDLDAQIRRAALNSRDSLGLIEGKNTAAWIEETKKGIQDISEMSGVAPEQLLAGLEQVRAMSGDVGLAMNQMALAAEVAVVNGAEVADVLGMIDVLNKKANVSQAEMRSTINMIAAMGGQGAFDLKEFAGEGGQMMTALPMFGQAGKVDQKAIESLTAIANIAMSANGNSPEMARTSILALAADMADTTILKANAKKAGLGEAQFNDLVYTDKSKTTRRSAEDFLKKLVEITGGNVEQITIMLNESSRKIANTMANNWRDSGQKFAYLESLRQAGADSRSGDRTGEGFRDMSQDPKVQMDRALAMVRGVAQDLSRLLIDGLAPAFRLANEHGEIFKAGVIGLGAALATAAGIVIAGKAKQFIEGALGAWRGSKGGAGGIATGMGMPGVTPVWIVGAAPGVGGIPGIPTTGGVGGTGGAATGAAQTAARGRGLFSRWIGAAGSTIGNTARNLAVWGQGMGYGAQRVLGRTAAGRLAMRAGSSLAEYGSTAWRNATWGSGMAGLARMGGRAAPLLRGTALGSLVGLPIEYLMNGFNMRSTVAGLGSALGGTAGFLGGSALGAATTAGVGAPLLAYGGAVGGGIAGREGALAIYDLVSGLLKRDAEIAADKEKAFSPELRLMVSFDAMGRPTTRVDGPGASAVKLSSAPLGPMWSRLAGT